MWYVLAFVAGFITALVVCYFAITMSDTPKHPPFD